MAADEVRTSTGIADPKVTGLNPANWSTVAEKPVLIGNTMEVVIPQVGNKYYRLRKP